MSVSFDSVAPQYDIMATYRRQLDPGPINRPMWRLATRSRLCAKDDIHPSTEQIDSPRSNAQYDVASGDGGRGRGVLADVGSVSGADLVWRTNHGREQIEKAFEGQEDVEQLVSRFLALFGLFWGRMNRIRLEQMEETKARRLVSM